MRWVDRSSRRNASSVVAGAAALAVLVPRIAEACSCVGAVEIVAPGVDQQHPASAGMLFGAWCFSGTLEVFSATIDDVPATLSFEYVGGDWHVATIDPLPQPGQVVAVSQCGDGFERCTPETPVESVVQYTAGPADAVAPAGGGTVTLQHESGELDNGCFDAALRFDVVVSGLEPAGDRDLLYTIALRDAGGRIVDSTAIHAPEPITTLDTSFYRDEVPADVAGYCVSVTAIDLSGNSTFGRGTVRIGVARSRGGDRWRDW
jgi:hypothetical protein